MKFGLVIYAIKLQAMIVFYKNIFQHTISEDNVDYVTLTSSEFELVILQTPKTIKQNISILIPALPREKTPIKPVFFSSKSMTEIIKQIKDMGGQLNSKDKGNLLLNIYFTVKFPTLSYL